MAHELPMITARELIVILERLGFSQRTASGTGHRRYVHPDGRRTTVPYHSSHPIGRGLLRKILRDIKLRPEEFQKLL